MPPMARRPNFTKIDQLEPQLVRMKLIKIRPVSKLHAVLYFRNSSSLVAPTMGRPKGKGQRYDTPQERFNGNRIKVQQNNKFR